MYEHHKLSLIASLQYFEEAEMSICAMMSDRTVQVLYVLRVKKYAEVVLLRQAR